MTDAALPHFTRAQLELSNSIELPHLTNDDAVDLGLVVVSLIRERHLHLAVDVVVRGDLVFRAKTDGTGPENDEWLSSKAAVVRKFDESSLLVKVRHLDAGTPFDERDDVDHSLLKAFGGSLPLRAAGETVGTLTVSGEADVVDHQVAIEGLERYLARTPQLDR